MAVRPPNTPSYDSVQQNLVNRIMAEYKPRTPQFKPIPTFGKSYYMPTDSLKWLNQLATAKPSVNTKQLQQIASNQTALLTNPQIETLRQQLAAFSSLIPQARKTIDTGYATAQKQLGQGVQDVVAAVMEQAARQGGVRPGVYDELTREATNEASLLSNTIEANRSADIAQIIGALEIEKRNAQEAINALKKNRKNLTKQHYDALYDDAVNKFRQAQQQQIQLMNQIVGMEATARSESAKMAQERAKMYNQYQADSALAYNQYLRDLTNQQMAQAEEGLRSMQAQWLNQWMDYITSSPNTAAARQRLEQNRQNIINSIGVDGYNQLKAQVESLPPGWTNPNWSMPLLPQDSRVPRPISQNRATQSTRSGPPTIYPNNPVSSLLTSIWGRVFGGGIRR